MCILLTYIMLASCLKMSEITSLTIAVKWGRGLQGFQQHVQALRIMLEFYSRHNMF